MSLAVARSHHLMRENPPSSDEGFPLIVSLVGDNSTHIAAQLQQQYLVARGLRPAFAVIAAELIFGGGE